MFRAVVARGPGLTRGGVRALSVTPPKPVTPDYNTSVEVDKIRLAKPKRPGSWKGLDTLENDITSEGSLVDQTLKEMANDAEFQLTAKKLKVCASLLPVSRSMPAAVCSCCTALAVRSGL